MTQFKKRLLKWAVKNILRVVDIDEVLRIEKGEVYIGKEPLSDKQVSTLKAQAKTLKHMLVWELIRKNLYWIANHKMMRGANKEIDMINGRMMTLCIDTIEEFVDKLENL